MAWHIVEKYLEQTAEHSTLVGKFWVTFFFVLRFLMVVSIADSVFGDEQGAFVCNTNTPGCSNVCYNEFSPISLIRLWALQVLCVALPSVIFIIYTAHKLSKISQAKKLRQNELDKIKKEKEQAKKLKQKLAMERKMREQEGIPPEYREVDSSEKKEEKKEDKGKKDDEEEKVCATKLDSDTPSRLMLAYVAQVILRLIVEVGFMVIQFSIYVFKFWVPELFKCARYPCPNVVDCFVSRPKEKSIMLWVMFATGLVMIVLNLVELYHLGIGKIWEAWKTRGQDITKQYKLTNNMPMFGGNHGGGRYGNGYPRGYPQAVGIRVGYARSSISGEGGDAYDGDKFI